MVFGELIAFYLFFGGAAAGAFLLLVLYELGGRERCTPERRAGFGPHRGHAGSRLESLGCHRVLRIAHPLVLIILVIGMACLLADLGRPEFFYLLFLHPTLSFVSIGSFALLLLLACMALASSVELLDVSPTFHRVAFVAKVIGAFDAIVVMAYTGLLLMRVIGVPLWRSAWLPVLFVLSAISCGAGIIALVERFCGVFDMRTAESRRMVAFDSVIIVLEMIVAVAYSWSSSHGASARGFEALVFGDQAWLFLIGFALCGLIVPLVVNVASLLAKRPWSQQAIIVGAILALAGGFCLRFALVGAGVNVVY